MTAATSLHKAFVVVLFSVLATAITTPSLPENTNTDGNANNNNNNNNTNSTDIIHIYFSNKPSGTNSTSLLDVSLEYYRKYTNKTIKVHNFNTNAEALSSMLSAPADGRHLGAVGVPHILFYGSVDDRARPFTAEDLSLVYVNSYSPVVLVSAIYSSFDSLLKSAGALGPDDDEYMTLCSPIKYDAYYMLHKNIQKSYPALAAKLRYTVYSAEDGNYAWRTISTMCAALYCDVSTAINLGAAAHVLGVTSEQAVIDLPDTPIFKNIGIDDQRTTIYRGFAVSKNVPDEKKFELVDWLAKVSKVKNK